VTGTGDVADYITPGGNYFNGLLLDTLFLGSAGSTIRVADFVLWGEELSDADCHTLAESGIRATLAVSAPTISAQPTGQSVTAPATANFTATVSGTYTGLRWQRQAAGAGGWADVSGGTGGTTTSYTTGATAVSGGSFNSTDRFRLAVDWSGGVVYSTDVALTVASPVPVLSHHYTWMRLG